MKKLILFIGFAIIIQTYIFSQSCLPQGIRFTSQEQIDNFQTNYPGCTEIEGDISIYGNSINNLNGINVLTACHGELYIESCKSLTSLSGLENINSLGSLYIVFDDAITDLAGLQGLNTITSGPLYIYENLLLTTLSGLDNLITIEDGIELIDNQSLINIDGLESLSFIKKVNIEYNSSLSNLQGLENTTSIAEDFLLHSNNTLVDLTGLDNITTIGGKLSIDNNSALTSLVGLNNLDSVSDLYINNNPSLSTCDIGSICNYLSNPNGSVNIYNNASGCNSPSEIANLCGFTLPCLPHGNYYLFSQADIDDFQTYFTNCTSIEGNITINGSDITNLEGLSTVSSIGGYFLIYQNDALQNLTGLDSVNYIGEALAIYWNDSLNTLAALSKLTAIGGSLQFGGNNLMSLSGLDNLTEIGGSLIISGTNLTSLSALSNVTAIGRGIDLDNNDALINLSGLNNISSIGGELSIYNNDNLINLSGLENVTYIEGNLLIGVMPIGGNRSLNNLSGLDNVTNVGGDLLIYNNNSLVSLTALSNLTSLGGHLEIFDNLNIASLAGIENIDSESIADLFIFDNSSLIYCEVRSVCEYLSSPNGIIYIYNNAAGCNTQTEVEAACSVLGLTTPKELKIEIYPNPANKNLYISNIFGLTIKNLTIYNLLGQEILHETTIPNEIDLSNLDHGIYVVEIELENSRIKRKLIIEK